jgi:hypothetical protein
MPIYALNTPASVPDQRDIPFVPSVWPPSIFASEIDLMPDVAEVEDQLHIGSCVAHGIVSSCENMAKRHGQVQDLSRMFLYTATLDYENRLGEEGLAPRDAYKVAYKYGIPPESTYPYDTSLHTVRPPDNVYQIASQTRVRRYEAVTMPGSWLAWEQQEIVDRIKSALNEGLPVGVAFDVSPDIFGMSGLWRQHQYRNSGHGVPSAGGHFMLIIGYDDRVGKFLVQNSWGPNWGDGGFGGFPYGVVSSGFFEAWVVRNWDGLEIPQSPGIRLEGQNRFRIQARIIPEPQEIGSTTPLWIGAQLPTGDIWLKHGMAGNDWRPYDGANMPATGQLTLEPENLVWVVEWMNLAEVKGAMIHVAYGPSPWNWKMQHICTVPSWY